MNETELLRELDAWIADHFLVWRRLEDFTPPIAWVNTNGDVVNANIFRPTILPSAFSMVKREIERRKWTWHLDAYWFDKLHGGMGYQFIIYGEDEQPIAKIYSDSEELAGCLAVKMAIEEKHE